MSKNQQYAMKYAEYAMEQMRRYGIPASVTLAQGILESSNGQSRLAQTRTIILASRLRLHGLPKEEGMVYILTISRMRSFAVMTVWVIHTNTTPVFKRKQPLCPMFCTFARRLQGLDTKYRTGRLCHRRRICRESATDYRAKWLTAV